ncbi:enoyl-CoA hydratase-related protein [Mesorhizobium sp. LHD-90]|uniref:enoyl-CoA hydratase/isomerase family protein n=1 Tax=Mesorhizobium sp. LHD-90 TaxID=3071414 RepID=UPI0027E0F60D|nr:enoyl-CoA hydratase-related protein [Mesorhizobium sp. LHD-90]MDQ6433207.1 enoyl-CoA hydratase-related protein [Mesorhizobium sp. LHD-90]
MKPLDIRSPNDAVQIKAGDGRSVELWLNRPDRMNALSREMVSAVRDVVRQAVEQKAGVVVLRAHGRAFCAGADLKQRATMTEQERYAHNRAISALADELAAVPVPTIAVIHGAALGGGLEISLACDIRLSAEEAMIGLTEARLGAIPGAGGTQRLPRLIGKSQALYLMYAGEPVTGRRAADIGMVNLAVPADELGKVADTYVATLATRSLDCAMKLKDVVARGCMLPLDEGLECEHQALLSIFGSADYLEGIAAFAEKRPPRFPSLGYSDHGRDTDR